MMEWNKYLDDKIKNASALIDLCKTFEYIPHDLFVTKLHACGLSIDAVTFLPSYVKRRKKGVEKNSFESIFQILVPGLLQGLVGQMSYSLQYIFKRFIHFHNWR